MRINFNALEDNGFNVEVTGSEVIISSKEGRASSDLVEAMHNSMVDLDASTREMIIGQAVENYNNQLILAICNKV